MSKFLFRATQVIFSKFYRFIGKSGHRILSHKECVNKYLTEIEEDSKLSIEKLEKNVRKLHLKYKF